MLLKFIKATEQAKLKEIAVWIGYVPVIYSFSLPSGYTCPFAVDCLSKADRVTGKITDGIKTLFRCFSASDEARSPTARKSRWHNFDILRKLDFEGMVTAIYEAVPSDLDICRVHVGGDFFNQKYFEAWLQVARLYPNKLFYAYTKSIPYWVANLGDIPENFILNASRGSRADNLIDKHLLKVAEVVYSLEDAAAKGLEIDHDELHAIQDTGSFALLLHGTQPKGSAAGEALKELNKNGTKHSYSRKKTKVTMGGK